MVTNKHHQLSWTAYSIQVFIACILLTTNADDALAEQNEHIVNRYHINQIFGNDNYDGSVNKPFSTISKCAKIARPGDTCFVHAGTYRETVRPWRSGQSGKPITFIAAPGDRVLITGLDKLTSSWNKISPTVFATKTKSHIKQLFINNSLVNISHTPNINNYLKPTYATITSAQCMTHTGTWSNNSRECKKYDEDGPCSKSNSCWDKSFPKTLWRINSPGIAASPHWKGGIIAILSKGSFHAERATIIQSNPENGIVFEWFEEKPLESGMRFTITNSLAAIDSDGEWSYNTFDRTLYLDPPGNNIPKNIFVRTRDLAFDLRGKSYVSVIGFKILAASIETGPNSSHCILNKLDVSYPVYYQMFGATKNYPGQGTNRHKIIFETMGKGITLGGTMNTLQNSTISHSWCDGVSVYGTYNTVKDNQIYDINWSMTACAAVSTNGNKHLVTRNRMYNCGRSCLWHQSTFDSVFSYNDIFDACWLGNDCGITGTIAWYGKTNDLSSDADGDSIGNIMHHNWIHDNRSADGGVCLYLDNNERDYLLHHNVLWGCKFAFALNDTYIPHGATGHQVYNNTCFDVEFRISDYGSSRDWRLQDVKFSNNLCTTSKDAHYNIYNAAETELENNVGPIPANSYAYTNPSSSWSREQLKLMDISNKDFRPRKNSPAQNGGKAIPGITPIAIETPSAGAYEYSQEEAWKAGPVSSTIKQIIYDN